ncbi:MAG: hypothetical protein ACOCV0_00715 [Alkalispirochaeta sp.]
MYYLLIEAVGMWQASRINPDVYDHIRREIDQSVGSHGMHRVHHESDRFLFRAPSADALEPEEAVACVADIVETCRAALEHLLSFTVLLDYDEDLRSDLVATRMERLLRYARNENAAYLTETVAVAVEPHVELVQAGGIYQVVSFRNAPGISDRSYSADLRDPEVQRTIAEIAADIGDDDDPRSLWIDTDDISVTVDALEQVLPGDVYTVRCAGADAVSPLLHRLIRCIRERLCEENRNRPTEATGGVTRTIRNDPPRTPTETLLRRFSEARGGYVQSSAVTGEMSVALSAAIGEPREDGPVVWVVLEALDETEFAIRDALLETLRGVAARNRRYRFIAVVGEDSDFAEREPVAPSGRWIFRSLPVRERPDEDTGTGTGTGENGGDKDGESFAERRFERACVYWAQYGGAEVRPERFTDSLAQNLRTSHFITILVVHRLVPVLDGALIDDLFPLLGVSLAERSRIMKDLTEMGIVRGTIVPELHRLVASHLPAIVPETVQDQFDTTVAHYLLERIDRLELPIVPAIWSLFRGIDEAKRRELLHHALLHQIVTGGDFSLYERFAPSPSVQGSPLEVSDVAARIKLYLRDSRGPQECAELYHRAQRLLAATIVPEAVEADVHLALGEFFLARRNYPEALAAVKRAVMMQQDEGWTAVHGRGPAMSHLLMARIMLAQRRLNDAGQYLGFAREEALRDEETSLIARSLEGIRQFVIGNLTRAYRMIGEVSRPLLEGGYTEWYVLVEFLLGRVNYELGEYEIAGDLFRGIAAYCDAIGLESPGGTIAAWELRSHLALGGASDPPRVDNDSLPESAEKLFFIAEALTRAGRFSDALPYLESADERESEIDRWPRLGVCWDNGFASVEDLVIADGRGSTELRRLIRSYYAWTLAHLDRQEEAVPIFYALTRGSEGGAIDPYAGLYNYLYSSVLPKERSGDRDDRMTVLGKSVKLIQERTSRIDEYRDKMRFLKRNGWNQQLMQEARKYNLV